MELKIVTFNMKNDYLKFSKNHWSKRRNSILEFFHIHKPEIVGTQELTAERIKALEVELPEYKWVGKGRRKDGTGEFCAIFYKEKSLTYLEGGTFWLSKTPEVSGSMSWGAIFPRICTWGLFRTKEGELLAIYNTHLDHISGYSRQKSVAMIEEYIYNKEYVGCGIEETVKCALMGDFNTTPSGNAMKKFNQINISHGLFFESSYHVFLSKTYHGFHGNTSGKPIDYIFTSNSMKIKKAFACTEKLLGVFPSDHFPIVMEVEV